MDDNLFQVLHRRVKMSEVINAVEGSQISMVEGRTGGEQDVSPMVDYGEAERTAGSRDT